MVRSVIVTARRPAKLFILGLSALGMGVLVYALGRRGLSHSCRRGWRMTAGF